MHRLRSLLVLALASSLTAVGLVAASPTKAAGDEPATPPDCGLFDDPIYQVVKPRNDASLLTRSEREATGAARYGFTENQGEVFTASAQPGAGLVEVHRLYRNVRQDFLATADPEEWAAAVGDSLGYVDNGVNFYASPVPADCLVPVYRYEKDTRHRLAARAADRAALVADGWSSEGVAFYAGAAPDQAPEPAPEPSPTTGPEPDPAPRPDPVPPPAPAPAGDTEFSFAAYPDTQQEVLSSRDTRFLDRAKWLVNQKSELDLRWATHSGDLVNWDTAEHEQYEIASAAYRPLESAGIPYTIAIGNHDTMATGPGGGARDPKHTRAYQRDTTTFNSYFTASRYTRVGGAYESGKVDNIYSLYEAGGVKWMVLVLELWPREAVVDWAKQVVASHPDHNVILVTHEYMDDDGTIAQSAGYGDTSAQYLYDNLVSQYPNFRMVLSGHVGWAGSRVDTGKHGNKIYSFLTTIHSNTTNPVRLFTIDTKAGTIKTWIYAPATGETYGAYSKTLTGVDFVR